MSDNRIPNTRYRLWEPPPAELLPVLADELCAVESYLPAWVSSLGVFYDHNPKGHSKACQAEVKPCLPYRFAQLWVYPRFFSHDAAMKRSVLIHEINHLHTAGLYFEGLGLLQNLEMPDGVRELLKGRLKDSWEAACEDIALAVGRLVKA